MKKKSDTQETDDEEEEGTAEVEDLKRKRTMAKSRRIMLRYAAQIRNRTSHATTRN